MYSLLIASVAASLASSATASNDRILIVNGVATARISTAGVDLQSAMGRKQVTRRIRLAAERVCVGTFVDTGITAPTTNPCYVAAISSGLSQMNALAGS